MNVVNERTRPKKSHFEITKSHHGPASRKWTHYPFVYERVLSPLLAAEQPLTLLEIGVQNGGSLEIWKKFLPTGSQVHGLDVDANCAKLRLSPGIHFHLGSATDTAFVNQRFVESSFDIIVDNARPDGAGTVSAFLDLFKKLRPGGVYIVEGLRAGMQAPTDGSNAFGFFKNLIDSLNTDNLPKSETQAAREPHFLSMYREDVASVTFFDAVCAISKYQRHKRESFQPFFAGDICQVVPGPITEKLENRTSELELARTLFEAPSHTPNKGAPIASNVLFDRAVEAFNRRCLDHAVAMFTELMVRNPNDPVPPAWLAFVCALQGLPEEANEFFGQSKKLCGTRADLAAALGESFLQMHNPASAETPLREALAIAPDLWAAHIALAQSLFQQGKREEAVSVLEAAVQTAQGKAQNDICYALINIQAQRGDLDGLVGTCERFSTNLSQTLCAVRGLSWIDRKGERLNDALKSAWEYLSGIPHPVKSNALSRINRALNSPIHVAFLTSNIDNLIVSGRLSALLAHLPPREFVTSLVTRQTPDGRQTDRCSLSLLTVDNTLVTGDKSGLATAELIDRELNPDILIDLDAYGPQEFLEAITLAKAPHKLLWGETPLPPVFSGARVLTGNDLNADTSFQTWPLPGIGDLYDFPDLPLTPNSNKPPRSDPIFACLTPASRIGAESWRLFANVLQDNPKVRLILNLGQSDTRQEMEAFVRSIFQRTGIDDERLSFAWANTREALCRQWWQADVCLCPIIDSGDLALPTALWMGRSCIAIESPLTWSRRASVLLRKFNGGQGIVTDERQYLQLARQLAAYPPEPDNKPRANIKNIGLHNPAGFAQGLAKAMQDLLAQGETPPRSKP